jgi:hypothetical protein
MYPNYVEDDPDLFESGIGAALQYPYARPLHGSSTLLNRGTWEITLRHQNGPTIHANDERIAILRRVLDTNTSAVGLRQHLVHIIETWSDKELTAIWERSSGIPVGTKFRIKRNCAARRNARGTLSIVRQYFRRDRTNDQDGEAGSDQGIANMLHERREEQSPGGIKWDRWVGITLSDTKPPETTLAWIRGNLRLFDDSRRITGGDVASRLLGDV